jgi:hypothetical protein
MEKYSAPGSKCRTFFKVQLCLLDESRDIEMVSLVVKNRTVA